MRTAVKGIILIFFLCGTVAYASGIVTSDDDKYRGVLFKTEKRDLDKKYETGKVTETEYIGILRHLKERYPVVDKRDGQVSGKEDK
ncbi:MAG TPA: hypothetical protein PKY78_05840 [Candidatus Omnitrophota bacterium]|nr:hypothetical protein [Candidatus Omnitrophota bacterium]